MKSQAIEIKERPILFSTEMVKAILDGRKTQTRRVIKDSFNGCWTNGGPHPCPNEPIVVYPGEVIKCEGEPDLIVDYTNVVEASFHCSTMDKTAKCPYGKPGDQLWVRETWHPTGRLGTQYTVEYKTGEEVAHKTPFDFASPKMDEKIYSGWQPSIFMPREASRITLEITDIRVERVQDISEKDAISEGVEFIKEGAEWGGKYEFTGYKNYFNNRDILFLTAKESFCSLWDSINAKRGYGWDVNPWVWVVEFRKI